MSLSTHPIAFVDIETTGGSPYGHRIIEIGVVRVENNREVARYKTFVDPGEPVPYFITNITGITDSHLEGAPTFRDVSNDLRGVLEGCIFIAHNVRFDYSFIEEEFRRIDQAFEMPRVCTAQLSRYLFPQFRRHNLDSLVARHKLIIPDRHRAFDDAMALWQFYRVALSNFDLDAVEAGFSIQLRRQGHSLD